MKTYMQREAGRVLAVMLLLVVGCDASGEDAENAPPVFTSSPVRAVDHNAPYTYQAAVNDPDGDSVTIEARIPDWLTFDAATRTLSGEAGWDNVGEHRVTLVAEDGAATAFQTFILTVRKGEIRCDVDFGDPSASPYVLPFKVGASYRLIQGYCPSNPAWGHHNWFAYDFDTAIGDTITASRAGRVLFVREQFADGNRTPGEENFVFIRHDDGTVMQYVHFTRNGALVDVGDRVVQGQPIGLSGDSGNSSGPHVHVALFRDQTDFNRQATLPFNYRNAGGPLDANRGLVFQAPYTAQPFMPQ